jgi:hypothetical protein
MDLLGISVLGFSFSLIQWVGITLVVLVIGTGVWFVLTHRPR